MALSGVLWCDRAGQALRNDVEGTQKFRTTKEEALRQTGAAKLDLIDDVTVELGRSLPGGHRSRRARYRATLKDGDPAARFVSDDSQAVKSTGPHTAEITVYALRGDRPGGGNSQAPADPPTDADRQPNNQIQSDDPKIVAMAREAAGDEQDPWQVALKLERYVDRYIRQVGFSEAYATAADVAEKRAGDCTEHAVLLAALARARGIPARVAIGLVYMPGRAAMGYHAWTQVYVGGRWVGLDATLGQGGIGAGHLELAHSNLRGASAYSSMLPIVQVVNRLKIEVLEAE